MRSRHASGTAVRLIAPTVVLVAVIGAWEAGLLHAVLNVRQYSLALPSEIAAVFVTDADVLRSHGWITLREVVAGYVAGSAAGFAVAVTAVRSALVRTAVTTVASAMNASPIIALAPLMILWFGGGMESKIALVALMTFGPMAVLATKGFLAVDDDARLVMRSFAAGRLAVFRKLQFPTALPYLFTALKLNVSLAWIGAIVGEFVASDGGIGQRMMQALSLFDQPAAWAAIVVCAAGGIGGYLLVAALERRVMPWHSSIRAAG